MKKQSQFLKGQMSLSIYVKGDYEEFHALRRRKYKAKQSQFIRIEYSVSPQDALRRSPKDCVMRIAKWNLKKQTQFSGEANWRKVFFERKL